MKETTLEIRIRKKEEICKLMEGLDYKEIEAILHWVLDYTKFNSVYKHTR